MKSETKTKIQEALDCSQHYSGYNKIVKEAKKVLASEPDDLTTIKLVEALIMRWMSSEIEEKGGLKYRIQQLLDAQTAELANEIERLKYEVARLSL